MGNSFSPANDSGLELPLQSNNYVVAMAIMDRQICKPVPSTGKPKICIGPHYNDAASASLTSITFDYIASKSTGGTEEILQSYKAGVNNDIVREAKNMYKYPASHMEDMTDEQFQLRMIHDGCTMLLMSLHCLGYSLDHEAFGIQWTPQYQKEYFEDIFYPGNQICMLVLRKLLEQPFFKQIIENTKWRKPSDLLGKALYLCLLEPNLNITNEVSCLDSINTYSFRAWEDELYGEPSDVLHALHMLVLGREDYHYPDNGFPTILDEPQFSTASDLAAKGIRFKGVKGGIRGIKFKSNSFGGTLFMPAFTADEHIYLVFQVLVHYESTDNFSSEGEDKFVTSYLGLLKDLICTMPDTKILAQKGVIQKNLRSRNHLAGKLRGMNCTVTCEHIKYVKLQARDYSGVDWPKLLFLFVKVTSIVVILQAVYNILEYYRKK